MVNRLFIPPANRAFSDIGTPEAGAKLYVYENRTSTQVQLYTDLDKSSVLSQPLVADSDGVFAVAYADISDLVRILITDETNVVLNGYPQDDVALWPGEASDASGIVFSPTDDVPATNVQAAIEATAALSTNQTALIVRSDTVWPTGGTGNDYTITPSPVITSYAAGQAFWIKPNRTNTGAVTLNINGLGVRALQKIGRDGNPTALITNDLAANREIEVYDDGVRLLILARRDDFTFGSDSNGIWDNFGSGLMLCTGTVTLTYSSSAFLQGVWTFPNGGFAVAAKHCAGAVTALSAASVTLGELGPVQNPTKGLTTATFRVYKLGAASFTASDTLTITAEAIGRR